MINANELRLGNWVLCRNSEEEDFYNDQIITGDFALLEWFEKNPQEYTLFKPIELTPEILEKCGFEKPLTKNSWFRKGKFAAMPKEEGVIIEFRNLEILLIKSLHNLQNLYFALTGEELEVNL